MDMKTEIAAARLAGTVSAVRTMMRISAKHLRNPDNLIDRLERYADQLEEGLETFDLERKLGGWVKVK